MRHFPAILATVFALLHTAAAAQESSVHANMLWYGPYTTSESKVIQNSTTLTGTNTTTAPNSIIPPSSNSDRIPAKLGQRFGFGYVLSGGSSKTTVSITHARIFPNGGITNPKTGNLFPSEKVEFRWPIGEKSFIGYLFQEEYTLVPGVWTFQVFVGGRLLLEKSFTVYKP
jgi:hypothetical protein